MPTSYPPASILVVTECTDRWFDSPDAWTELLRLEGINDIETAHLDELLTARLDDRSLVLLGPGDPDPETAQLLLEWVRAGGGLICCAPGEAFAKALGLKPRLQGIMDGRVRVLCDGFPEAGLPIKGWTQKYDMAGKTGLVDTMPLMGHEGGATDHPAVCEIREGEGVVIVLAYDLAACVYLLRQGNPMLAGSRSTGFDRMRPSDLFAGWHEDRDLSWPVADLHGHLLRELIHRAWPRETVLPWLWYFPHQADTMLVFTSDDDWSTPEQFERLIDACETHEAGLTFYLVQERSVMDRTWLEDLTERGFDFSIHPDLPPPTQPLWDQRLADHVRQFRDKYDRIPSPSIRNHCITWSGYLEGVRIQARHGFTFDTNWFSLPPRSRNYMSGAGLPMRFVQLNGDVLPMFQLPTQFSDETTLGGQGFDFSLNLTPEQGIDLVTGLMMQNAAGTHSMLCVNAHPVSFATYSAPLWEPVLQFAHASGIPVWDVDRFSRFWQARREVRLRPIPAGQAPDLTGLDLDTHGLSVMAPASDDTEGMETRTVCGRDFVVMH